MPQLFCLLERATLLLTIFDTINGYKNESPFGSQVLFNGPSSESFEELIDFLFVATDLNSGDARAMRWSEDHPVRNNSRNSTDLLDRERGQG